MKICNLLYIYYVQDFVIILFLFHVLFNLNSKKIKDSEPLHKIVLSLNCILEIFYLNTYWNKLQKSNPLLRNLDQYFTKKTLTK